MGSRTAQVIRSPAFRGSAAYGQVHCRSQARAVLRGDFSSAAWGVYVSVNYIGPFRDTPDANVAGTRDVGEFTTVNVQLRYTGFEDLQLLLGLDNAFDEKRPFAVGNGDGDTYGSVQRQHNPCGQLWSFKAIYRF